MKLSRKTLFAAFSAAAVLPVSPFVVAGFIFIASLFTDAHGAEGGGGQLYRPALTAACV